jgi:hypothetical protein
VNKDLVDSLKAKGSTLVRSRGTAQQIQRNLGGLSFGTEDPVTKRSTENGGTTGKRDTTVPWTDTRVRQAMHKALHRDALRKVLDKGRATPRYVHGFSPDLAGTPPGNNASRSCMALTCQRPSACWLRLGTRTASRRKLGCSHLRGRQNSSR